MEGFGVLVFVIIAILAAFSNAKKAGQGTGAPRPRPGSSLPRTGQPYPRTPGDLPTPGRGEAPPVLVAGRVPDEAESAAALVPDDLWAILTGERRPAVRPPQRPLQTPQETTMPARAGRSVTQPVSLESAGMAERDSEEREALNARLAAVASARQAESAPGAPVASTVAAPAAAATTRPQAAPAPRQRAGRLLAGPADVRRAIVLRTVLGPPKALE